MPPHEVYIEPFAGSAAVARMKLEAKLNIVCDLDPLALELARTAGAARHRADSSPITQWITFQGDGLDFLEHHRFEGSELVYCDPPYVRETRKSPKDLYNFEWTSDHHSRLLSWAETTEAKVVISGYRCNFYDTHLCGDDWRSEDFQAMTRRGPATETLWWNFERPTILHDDRFLGDGFRERERIRRRQKRWIAKLEKMDPAERAALIAAVSNLA